MWRRRGQRLGSYKHPEVQIFSQSLSELYVTFFSLEMWGSQCSSWDHQHIINPAKSVASSAGNIRSLVSAADRSQEGWILGHGQMPNDALDTFRWSPMMWMWPSGNPWDPRPRNWSKRFPYPANAAYSEIWFASLKVGMTITQMLEEGLKMTDAHHYL